MKLPAIIESERVSSPAVTPQALAWHSDSLWMGSRDLRRIYKIDPPSPNASPARTSGAAGIGKWMVLKEAEAPGIPWAAVATNGSFRFTIGEGANDDRYVYRYNPSDGFSRMFACPEFTGSYLSFDGQHLYLSQWYKERILKLDPNGEILRTIGVGAEICGHTFVDGTIYVLRGKEQPNEDWRIARLDPRQEKPEVKDLARVPFACRSLTFDGTNFWTNHRAANEIVSFVLPD